METELHEHGLCHDALDLGLGVMRKRSRRVDRSLVEHVRDPALQVLSHAFAFAQ
jgi:hypothetical protein